MKNVFKYLKILIAAILVGIIAFFGIRYYLEQRAIKESESALVMEQIIKNANGKNKEVTLEEVNDEEKINALNEYIDKVYLTFEGIEPLPEFTDIDYIDEKYITRLAFENASKDGESSGEEVYYSYPELNRVIVGLLGKNAHNMIPDKTTDYFQKTTDGFSKIGMCGSEVISYKYFIDSVHLGSDGLYYVSIYEYKTESEGSTVDFVEAGEKIKVNVKNIKDEFVYEYYDEAVAYDESTISIVMVDKTGKQIEFEDFEKQMKKEKEKLVKRTLAIEYDESLDLYYLKSNILETK